MGATASRRQFDETVIEDSGFSVHFSNAGKKRHPNPNPVNYEKEPVRCADPSCNRVGTYTYGVCTLHQKSLIHTADWVGILRPSAGVISQAQERHSRADTPIVSDFAPAHSAVTEYLVLWMETGESRKLVMDNFIQDCLETVVGKVPDATTLQENLDVGSGMQPNHILRSLRTVVDRQFPQSTYQDEKLEGVRVRIGEVQSTLDIPVRCMAALLAVGLACEESNRGDLWFRETYNVNPAGSKRASAYMSIVYYLLRRHTRATPSQARISQRA